MHKSDFTLCSWLLVNRHSNQKINRNKRKQQDFEMAPRRRQPKKNTRTDAAYDAMKKYGFPLPIVKKTLKKLLKVYTQAGWPLIEEESYRVLTDAILETVARNPQEQEGILQQGGSSQAPDTDDIIVMGNESATEGGSEAPEKKTDAVVNESATEGGSEAPEKKTDAVVNESATEDGNHDHDVSKNIHASPKSVETDSHLPVPEPQRKPSYGWITDCSDHDEDDFIELTPEPLPESIIRQLNEAGLGHLIEKYQG
ncbi:hypothetical protein ACFE04_003043 [Oxalis oulophora]